MQCAVLIRTMCGCFLVRYSCYYWQLSACPCLMAVCNALKIYKVVATVLCGAFYSLHLWCSMLWTNVLRCNYLMYIYGHVVMGEPFMCWWLVIHPARVIASVLENGKSIKVIHNGRKLTLPTRNYVKVCKVLIILVNWGIILIDIYNVNCLLLFPIFRICRIRSK